MSKNVSEFIIERIHAWGIKRVFGYPGDGINGVMGALDKLKDKVDFIQVAHEENAAFMACGHAKFTGEVGVCISTSGPGAIHMLNGLYDAKLDHQPVVAIVGQQARMSLGGEYQQEVDLVTLFKDVAHHFVHMVTDPNQVRHVVDRAIRIAKAERTVTCVILPNDVQELDAVEEPPHKHGSVHTGIGHSLERPVPPMSELQKAAAVLNEGKKVAILAGVGAAGAPEELKQVAEVLGAGIAKALLGRAILPDDLPYVTGAIGLLGTSASWEMMSDCDTLLMIGTGFPYSEFLPKEGQARAVQIDIDPKMVSLRYPTEVNLIGDAQETLKALIPLLQHKEDRSWRQTIEKNVADWWKVVEAKAMVDANPINPQRVLQELSPRLPDRCILTADSGSSATWFARNLKIREGMMASLSGTLATMCPGVPYITAAKFAYPDRIPIAIIGDGAMQMLGINGMITIAKYWKKWADPRMVILVLNNRDLNMVTWEQRVTNGNPEFVGSQELMDFQYAKYAELLGLKGIRVENPDEIGAALDAVLSADRPALLEVVVDPAVPPLPPHITAQQMVSFSKALLKGDNMEMGLIKQSFKDLLQEVLH
ncbi:thiamine pyrophosphate-requiring protein [Mucilaginibacter sp. Bleaf8]|uniref:thiamine pyrophosphate-requiring protein n=1 Tax=Mucilaginibacter sp. Bleaf8 TaxID=2834430 RepID=UPI001BCE0B0F|nr:thiamine pyrophosphate-requiring protein [Mucilaginibacter sp. Bleaf8]MBS7563675.1 thiamine pyrophosphate-requiring protein [Mucilaginibacter sp. Bleaf8]